MKANLGSAGTLTELLGLIGTKWDELGLIGTVFGKTVYPLFEIAVTLRYPLHTFWIPILYP